MNMDINFPNLHIYLEHVGKNINVFGITIAYYGMIIALGMLLGVSLILHRAKKDGLDPDQCLDICIFTIIFAVIGARIYYVAFAWDYYKDNLLSIFNIRQGGLAIYGGVLAGILTAYIMCRIKKIPFLQFADLAAPGLLVGQIMGRWGNFFNREAFGDYTNSLFAMAIPTDYYVGKGTLTGMVNSGIITSEMANHMQVYDGMQWITVHPTFLYESVWNLLLLIVIVIYRKHKKFDGEIFLMYLWGYGLGRVWIEGLRSDSLMLPFLNMKVSQMLAAICVLVCSVLIVKKRLDFIKTQKPEGKNEQ